MFTFLEMLALVELESSFGAYVCNRVSVGLHRDQRSQGRSQDLSGEVLLRFGWTKLGGPGFVLR